jgi:hypothetical protein
LTIVLRPPPPIGRNATPDEELRQDFNLVFQAIATILLSRRMVEEGYLTHWGNAASKYPKDLFHAFAQRIVEARKAAPSDQLMASRWERTREVGALKQGEGWLRRPVVEDVSGA